MINAGYLNFWFLDFGYFWFLDFNYLIEVNYLTEVAAR
jgi:hypothetical protein